MGTVHRFKGKDKKFNWENVSIESYDSSKMKGVTKRVLIGKKEGAPYFVMRYFEIKPKGWTSLDKHPHDHGVIVLKGKGKVLLGNEEIEVSFGDAIHVPPNELHQFKNTEEEPFGFICVIPNKELVH
ncbi:cupin domain-containing protein [Patescibacteria group bacterium]|nr:cupin domain-containing protein [Patescibacteria group bacterium]